MKLLQNLHTHTTYCDGEHTPEEMIRFAMEKGFDSLGFSGHSYMFYSPYKLVSLEGTERYKVEVTALKEKYKGRFPVYLGLEVDMYSGVDLSGYDYLIGALHYLKLGNEYVAFDRPAETVQAVIDTRFSGNGLAFAKEYYAQLATLPQYGKFDILGHLDLLTKNIEQIPFFDIQSKAYLDVAREALQALQGKIPFFEVNTGAMARGYRTSPYPSLELLRECKRLGFGAIISSDCHDGRYLDVGFELSRDLLLEAGFTERYILTDHGFQAVAL
ncbi:MAG: histidinol-phosphatase [Clostridia bacterium]|nr:histidinol-phosphatase [Clostridia bacterium]